MKSKKEHEVKRKFGNNLSNNLKVINAKSKENINSNIQNYAFLNEKNYKIKDRLKSKKSQIHSKKEIKNQFKIILENPKEPNTLFLDEYLQDIIKNIIFHEHDNIVDYFNYEIFSLQDTQYINENSRKSIIELIAYYCYLWKLNTDSIYLFVNIMDRYIQKNKIKNNEYELIGLASFFIASKYEDIYSPDVEAISKIFSFKYHYEDILDKESQILQSLDYRFYYISSFKVLNLLYYLSDINNINVLHFASMALELSLIDLNIMKYSQIKRAVASFILAKKVFQIKSGNNFIKLLFYYEEKEIDIITKKLLIVLRDIVVLKDKNNLIAEKYRSSKFNSIFSSFENQLEKKIGKMNKSKEK